MISNPWLVLVVSFVVLWCAARLGAFFRGKWELAEKLRDDFSVILAATLTLLGLIIGFTFSMALSRYDDRKNCEEQEANAIGTEYVRAGLLSANNEHVRALLKSYLDQRILFYTTRDQQELRNIGEATRRLQEEMWSAVQAPALAQPSSVAALAVSGMNDVLNTEGYAQAAWLNRIPIEAWGLMVVIAICCNLMLGYGAHYMSVRAVLLLILPLIFAISFFLIADIDTPRRGAIRVRPENLIRLAGSLPSR
jgi:hypothetical protein